MIQIQGKYNSAVCYASILEDSANEQIKTVCDQDIFADCKICIMPDVHAGKGCTIGTTMTITDKVVPGMVGVDIGCGIETVHLNAKSLDFELLDEVIRKYIPSGFEVRRSPHEYANEIHLSELCCARHINIKRAYKSIGTLGSGNHFIEIDRSENDDIYLVVHSGSRHLGCEVAEYYQTEGYNALRGCTKSQLDELIEKLKIEGRESEIQSTISKLKSETTLIPKDLAYVEGSLFDDYIHDMKITQQFAALNRKAMVNTILTEMHLSVAEEFTTIHNYIDTNEMILRKGAVSAKANEKLLIPINMRDGSLICIGKGNPDWNYSAPHGAGRLMSRKQAFHELTMEQYQVEMNGIYSTCVIPETLDESPMAYKPIDEIITQIEPTAEIVAKIKPLYNFKASEQKRKYK